VTLPLGFAPDVDGSTFCDWAKAATEVDIVKAPIKAIILCGMMPLCTKYQCRIIVPQK
jgi:hypothetical protein